MKQTGLIFSTNWLCQSISISSSAPAQQSGHRPPTQIYIRLRGASDSPARVQGTSLSSCAVEAPTGGHSPRCSPPGLRPSLPRPRLPSRRDLASRTCEDIHHHEDHVIMRDQGHVLGKRDSSNLRRPPAHTGPSFAHRPFSITDRSGSMCTG